MSAAICVLEHRHQPERERRTVDGLHVCKGCLFSLERTLAELPAQHTGLSIVLKPGQGAGSNISTAWADALPINSMVADHREHIARVLVSWAMAVAEQRFMTPPADTSPCTVATWLLVHLRWCCAQDWISTYAEELAQMRGRANALLFPSGRRHVIVGDCVERAEGPADATGALPRCPGRLIATVVAVDSLLPSSVDCDIDPEHTWTSGQWSTLGRKMHGPSGHDERAAAALAKMIRAS